MDIRHLFGKPKSLKNTCIPQGWPSEHSEPALDANPDQEHVDALARARYVTDQRITVGYISDHESHTESSIKNQVKLDSRRRTAIFIQTGQKLETAIIQSSQLDNQAFILGRELEDIPRKLEGIAKKKEELHLRIKQLNERLEKQKTDIYEGAIFIHVPYEQKNIAKRMGAQWCLEKSCWYIPRGLDVQSFFKNWKPCQTV